MDNVFVIGDVHGNLDRLEALLKQEGLLVWCDTCQGGEIFGMPEHTDTGALDVPVTDCDNCKGLGWARARKDVTVIQLGDLGHFGSDGSPTGDTLCYKYVTENRWCDVVLWGNHDRAVVDPQHAFSGFKLPRDGAALHFINRLQEEGRMQTAFDAHGFLLTHAGLAAHFKQQKVDDELKTDLVKFVDWINDEDDKYLSDVDEDEVDWQAIGVINAISHRRNGGSPVGGILWRDIEEGLYDGFRQIFGHSADHKEHKVRYVTEKINTRDRSVLAENAAVSYCIDIGGKAKNGRGHCLAGIWLPSETIVRADIGVVQL